MKAKVLMIGDLVMHNGYICRITDIESPWPRKDERFNDKYVISLWGDNGGFSVTEDEIEPVSLTEEILKPNGFVKCSYIDGYSHQNFPFIILIENGGFRYLFDELVFSTLYVHELQHTLRLCGLDDLVDNFKIKDDRK